MDRAANNPDATGSRAAKPGLGTCEFCGVKNAPVYEAADLGGGRLRPLRSEKGTCLRCTWRSIDLKALHG